jgi:hypothetical protein
MAKMLDDDQNWLLHRSGGVSSLIYCFNLRPHGTSSFLALIVAKIDDDDEIVKTGCGAT